MRLEMRSRPGWVTISAFRIQRWPVTIAEFARFVEEGYGDESVVERRIFGAGVF